MKRLAKILLILGIPITFFFSWMFYFRSSLLNKDANIDAGIWGQFGDLIGGVVGTIFSLVGVLLLVETLRGGEKSQIEAKIFELIKFHRENVNEISESYEGGRLIFKTITEEIKLLYEKVCEYEAKLIEDGNIESDFLPHEKLNVVYLIAYFGLNIENNEELKNKICTFTHCDTLMQYTLQFIPELRKSFSTENKIHNINIGYQFILGHYFRHLFQTYNYINAQEKLSYDDKYFYAKTLRAHLSNYEQILFFYNSISSLGTIWELKVPNKCYTENEENLYNLCLHIPFINSIIRRRLDYPNFNQKLVTKYNIIKNIPSGMSIVPPTLLYPFIEYEGEDAPKNRIKISRHYT